MRQSPNTQKHTPGPWHVEVDQASQGQCLCVMAGNEVLVRTPDLIEPMDEVNARLIAAAPELLRELKSALFYIESFKNEAGICECKEVFRAFAAGGNWEQIQALVAKAEGSNNV